MSVIVDITRQNLYKAQHFLHTHVAPVVNQAVHRASNVLEEYIVSPTVLTAKKANRIFHTAIIPQALRAFNTTKLKVFEYAEKAHAYAQEKIFPVISTYGKPLLDAYLRIEAKLIELSQENLPAPLANLAATLIKGFPIHIGLLCMPMPVRFAFTASWILLDCLVPKGIHSRIFAGLAVAHSIDTLYAISALAKIPQANRFLLLGALSAMTACYSKLQTKHIEQVDTSLDAL